MKHHVIVTTDEYDICKLIERACDGSIVRVLGIGSSMRPLLEGGRDYIDLIAVNRDTSLCVNDVVFYTSHDQQYVTHRIYSASDQGYHMLGDGNLSVEPMIGRERILLKAIGFVRKGRYISIDSKGYQRYVTLWRRLYPVRIHLLRLYQRVNKVASWLMPKAHPLQASHQNRSGAGRERNIRIKEDFMLRNINEDWIVIPMGERLLEFNGMMKLNQSGGFIWKLLEQNKSRADIIAAMLKEYDLDEETATRGFDTFLQALVESNILEA